MSQLIFNEKHVQIKAKPGNTINILLSEQMIKTIYSVLKTEQPQ